MRKIVFRGKRIDNGKWAEGFFVSQANDTYIFEPSQVNHGIDIGGYLDCCQMQEVIPETVGQCSTVADKNGVEMYEGDIVYGAAHWLERYKPAVVTFSGGSFGLLWHRGDVEEFDPFTSMCNVKYEVVGNIYDNPELMQDGETQ